MLDVGYAAKKLHHLVGAENDRQGPGRLGAGNDLAEIPRPLQSNSIQKSKCRNGDLDRARLQLLLVRQVDLVAADLLGPQNSRRPVEIPGELGNLQDVRGLRLTRQVPHLHVLGHALSKDRGLQRSGADSMRTFVLGWYKSNAAR